MIKVEIKFILIIVVPEESLLFTRVKISFLSALIFEAPVNEAPVSEAP